VESGIPDPSIGVLADRCTEKNRGSRRQVHGEEMAVTANAATRRYGHRDSAWHRGRLREADGAG